MEEKHKAIAIPVSFIDSIPYLLLVHDRRYKEWTFVTGGCRRRENFNPLRCALRELEEETRGILNIKSGKYSSFKFETVQTENGETFNAVYHVYIIDFDVSRSTHDDLVTTFNDEKEKMNARILTFRRHYDENDFMEFDTIEGIKNRSNVWPMIREHILENPEFEKQLYAPRQAFSFVY
jgi:8-oxo-dGTP pyrophosphatase MutT (NUDIX family)